MSVKWYGDQLLQQIRNGVDDAFLDGAEQFLDAAKSRAPRNSGDLVNSGYVANSNKSTYQKKKIHNKEVKPKPGQVIAGFAVFYAKFHEYGTATLSARPFMRPALDESKLRIGLAIVKSLAKKISNK